MTIEPKRLIDQDPGFAHLVAASKKDGPSNAQVDKALSLATRAAVPSSRLGSWFSTRMVIGLGVIGMSMLVLVGMRSSSSAGGGGAAPPALVSMPVHVGEATAIPSEPSEAPVGAPVMTVSVDDLAAAPPVASAAPSVDLSARRARAKIGENIDAKRTTFGEEVALVAAARSALEGGDVPSCMHAVDRYRERFGSGTFGQ
jgi:hypothetical protein